MRRNIMVIITILVFLLSGCDNQVLEEQVENNSQDRISDGEKDRWILKERDLSEQDEAWAMLIIGVDENEEEDILPQMVEAGVVYDVITPDVEDEPVYLCGRFEDGGFCIWKEGNVKPVFETYDVIMSVGSKVALANEMEGFLCTTEEIWQFSMQNGQIEKVMSFEEEGYSIDEIKGVMVDENGRLLMVVVIAGENILLERTEDTDWQNRKELELAVTYASSFLRETVVAFNKENEEYRIVLREPETGEKYDDFCARIQAEVSSGSGPDLLYSHVVNGVIDMQAASENGYLRNLTEDLDVYKSEMAENVRTVGEINGESYGVPYSFNVSTLVTADECGGKEGNLTSEEFMECVKDSNAETAIAYYSDSSLCGLLLLESGEKLIDIEKGICCLNSASAIEILDFAAMYGDKKIGEDVGNRLAEGSIFAAEVSVGGLNDVQPYVAMFHGKEVYIRVSANNTQENVLYSGTISVNKACEYPEAAITFIEYLLSQERQEEIGTRSCNGDGTVGFPVFADALEEMFHYSIEEQKNSNAVHVTFNGFEYEPMPLNEENLKRLQSLVQEARPEGKKEQMRTAIMEIIREEVSGYFSGDKTAQEVLDIVQNRVQLYMDEK
uniref:ABC transporter substrate-binding protein n=1 Tax=Acetatifactor sp. TaxID=1872090 RepID=UPI0040561082